MSMKAKGLSRVIDAMHRIAEKLRQFLGQFPGGPTEKLA
jgi:hypothetical protein